MSAILEKFLTGEFVEDEVIHWLLINKPTELKDGVDQIEFTRYLLDFLRKQTRLFLTTQELVSATAKSEISKSNDIPSTNIPEHQKLQFSQPPTYDLNFSTCQLLTPISVSQLHTPNHIPRSDTLNFDNSKTPSRLYDRNVKSNQNVISFCPDDSTPVSNVPFCSSSFNRAPFNSHNVTSALNVPVSSFTLLEKRLTSQETRCKTRTNKVELMDFIINKDKQKKKKKRVQPIRCSSVEKQENKRIVPEVEPQKTTDQVKKRITPISCASDGINRMKETVSGSMSVKLLKRIKPKQEVPDFVQSDEIKIVEQVTSKMESKVDIEPKSVESSVVQQISCDILDEKISSKNSTNQPLDVVPDTESIKAEHKSMIEKLALLYSTVLISNFIPDLLKELNFVISLLTSNVVSKKVNSSCSCLKKSNPDCLFELNTEINYFSAIVLEREWDLLKYLNKSTLGILCERKVLRLVAPKFVQQINDYIRKERTSSHQDISIIDQEILNETVKFKMDTDCRPNYASDQLFCAFKKQRDEFYSLLQDWYEDERGSEEFFKNKHKLLRSIFISSNASTNMFKLADLFVSQLLASVFNENIKHCEKFSLSGVSKTKLHLLNRRFITACSIVVGPDKRFPGVQEFFKDFLRSCGNPSFLNHIKDVLIQRIATLNNATFASEASVASARQESFLVCINQLCLLAKFLSLITFLPYNDKETLPPHLRIPLIEARKYVLPPMDLDGCLINALHTGRLLITIPWIVEFLNGIDDTSVQLPCYNILFIKLQYLLYKIKLPSMYDQVEENIHLVYSEEVEKAITEAHSGAVKRIEVSNKCIDVIGVGYLKSLASTSSDDFTKKFVNECVRTVDYSRILITLYVNSVFNNVSISMFIKVEDLASLTNTPILISSEFYIDDTALYQCCPQLHEIKALLEGNKRLSYKSIVPKTEKIFCDQKTGNVALETQMEMHFFSDKALVKRTVNMVAEQLSLHCERSIRTKILPELKRKLSDVLKTSLNEGKQMEDVNDLMLAKFYSMLRAGIKEVSSTLHTRIEYSLKGMLESDEREDENIFNICCTSTYRKCFEMIYNWILNYINFQSILEQVRTSVQDELIRVNMNASKNVDDKKTKKSKIDVKKAYFDNWISEKNGPQKWIGQNPGEVIHRLRHLTRIMTGRSPIYLGQMCQDTYHIHITLKHVSDNVISVERVLDDAISCIELRCDLQFAAFRRIMLLSLDFVSVLVFLQPNWVVDWVLEKLAEMWKYRKTCQLHLPFEQILSIRNVDILRNVPKSSENFDALEKYLCFMLKNQFTHSSRLFRQVLKLLQYEWQNEEFISQILHRVLAVLKQCESLTNEKIVIALESLCAVSESGL